MVEKTLAVVACCEFRSQFAERLARVSAVRELQPFGNGTHSAGGESVSGNGWGSLANRNAGTDFPNRSQGARGAAARRAKFGTFNFCSSLSGGRFRGVGKASSKTARDYAAKPPELECPHWPRRCRRASRFWNFWFKIRESRKVRLEFWCLDFREMVGEDWKLRPAFCGSRISNSRIFLRLALRKSRRNLAGIFGEPDSENACRNRVSKRPVSRRMPR